MNTCFRRGCGRPARYRLVLTVGPWWRHLLRLKPRTWQTCEEHRLDPMSRAHQGHLRAMHINDRAGTTITAGSSNVHWVNPQHWRYRGPL